MNGKVSHARTWEEAVQWLIDQPGRQDLVRDCFYDDPVEGAAERFSSSEEWDAVRAILGRRFPCRVLDIGAGRGISSYAFAKEGCEVFSLEPDKSPLVGIAAISSLSRRTGAPLAMVRGHGESLPFRNGSFDIVYGRAVLHHARDLHALCRNAAKVLVPGGIFMATREHVISRPEDLGAFLASHPLHALYGGENAHTLPAYETAIRAAGLKLRQVLGPHESVINYAPQTKVQHREYIAGILERFAGRRISRFLANLPWAVKFLERSLSRRSTVPGRLYSFIGEKP